MESMTKESDDEDDPNCTSYLGVPLVCLCDNSTCVHVHIMCFSYEAFKFFIRMTTYNNGARVFS